MASDSAALTAQDLRNMVLLNLYGFDKVLSMHEQMLRAVAGVGPESAL